MRGRKTKVLDCLESHGKMVLFLLLPRSLTKVAMKASNNNVQPKNQKLPEGSLFLFQFVFCSRFFFFFDFKRKGERKRKRKEERGRKKDERGRRKEEERRKGRRKKEEERGKRKEGGRKAEGRMIEWISRFKFNFFFLSSMSSSGRVV